MTKKFIHLIGTTFSFILKNKNINEYKIYESCGDVTNDYIMCVDLRDDEIILFEYVTDLPFYDNYERLDNDFVESSADRAMAYIKSEIDKSSLRVQMHRTRKAKKTI